MCSGSEVGSYLRLMDVVYHSTPGLRVKKEEEKADPGVFEKNTRARLLRTVTFKCRKEDFIFSRTLT